MPKCFKPWLTNSRRQNQDSESITSEDLACWLKDQKILNVVFTDYLHLPQYVEKLDKTLKLVMFPEFNVLLDQLKYNKKLPKNNLEISYPYSNRY